MASDRETHYGIGKMTYLRPSNLAQGLQKLAEFSESFDTKGFQFGEMIISDRQTGALVMPYYCFSDEADAFVTACYDYGWVLTDFDWGAWLNSPEGIELRKNHNSIARATPDQIAKLLTCLIRQERFSDGTLAAAFESGVLTAIARRAMTLADI